MVMTNSNSDMTERLEFLNEISLIQAKLFRPGIESEFPDADQKRKFKIYRLNWSIFVQRVEIDILSVLVDQLKDNQDDFEAGIKAINQEIQEIDDVVGFLKLLERGLSIIGKIINLSLPV